jgi:Transcription initiation factor IID, 18kD subunit
MRAKVGLLNLIVAVRNLMYGFGDDRNPSNDTVSVMEEILIEYITDVVSLLSDDFYRRLWLNATLVAVSSGWCWF